MMPYLVKGLDFQGRVSWLNTNGYWQESKQHLPVLTKSLAESLARDARIRNLNADREDQMIPMIVKI